MKHLATLSLILLFISCENKPKEDTSTSTVEEVPIPQEGVSFMGKPLYQRVASAEAMAKNDSLIDILAMKRTLTEDNYITLASYYVTTNRFRDAINIYTDGLAEYPRSFKIRRHRGHRYLSVRETEKAIIDLNEAVELLDENSVKELENDASGKPWGTYEHWIWYHIGLYHYLNADYAKAAEAYQKCIATAINGKNVVGPSDWLYNSYQKMGEAEKAAQVIEPITPDYDTDRNHSYFKRVMLYKGIADPENFVDLNKPSDQWTAGDITLAYALANWNQYNDKPDVAKSIYSKILEAPVWNTWAYVVTDKEMSR